MFQHGHSDPVVICPYDSNHKIARSRIQKHIVKCEKVYNILTLTNNKIF